jgi:hypothetical protein
MRRNKTMKMVVPKAPSMQRAAAIAHAPLGYKPPAPEVFIPALAARAASQPRPAPSPALAESLPMTNIRPGPVSGG